MNRWNNIYRLKEVNGLRRYGWAWSEIADHFSISDVTLRKAYSYMIKKFGNNIT